MQKYNLTSHAREMVAQRKIEIRWVELAVQNPTQVEADSHDADLQHRLVSIAENENRVLRVIVNYTVSPWRIVTVYFDRKLRGRI